MKIAHLSDIFELWTRSMTLETVLVNNISYCAAVWALFPLAQRLIIIFALGSYEFAGFVDIRRGAADAAVGG